MAAGAADAVPAEAELVRAFVNTLDHDEGTDALPDAAALTHAVFASRSSFCASCMRFNASRTRRFSLSLSGSA